MTQQIIVACWVIFCVYWLVSARKVKPVQENVRGRWWKITLLAGAALMGNFFGLSTRFPVLAQVLVPDSQATNFLVVLLVILGLTVSIVARKKLADNWSGSVTFREGHELITTGLYRYVRHPIYSGVLLMLLANVVHSGTVGACLGFVIIAVGMWIKLSQEEELLTRYFPNEYPTYKQKTKALIPNIL